MAAKNKFMNAMKMPAIADMFSSEADRQRESGDLVTEVPLSELHPFVNHPFEVRDDEDMQKLVDSIKENGVLTNLTVRPRAEGGYEIISGHRRFHAAQLAGLDKIKVQVRDVDDDQAIIDMVDANIQREHISPMEKARAYAMKLEAIAQDESRKTSERVKAGQKMSREKGVLYGSGNIIGYDRVDGTYVINEEQAATVRRIFNLYAEGHGETTVAKMLIEENRKDGGGGLSWTASKVSRVLRKPTYKGYMTYNKSHIDDFLSHNRINHSEEDFVLVKGNFEPIVSEALWETCNQIRSKRAAFVKGKDGRAHKFGVSFPQNKWTKILFCDCGMRFQIEGYDKTANGGKNMRLICARSKMFKKKDAARALNGIPCPAPYASEWKLELMAREVFRTVWKENAEDILGLLRMLDANLNTTGTPNDGNQLENKLSALNEELDDLVSQRASRSITMDDFLSRSTEINNEIINVEGLLQSSIQEQRPKARLDMHSIEAALSDDASFPDGKIEPGFLDRYANRIVKSNNRYIWMLQLVNVQQIMPIQSERQPIAMVTYKSGVPYDIEQEQTGKQDKESAGPDCATICRPQDFFLNMSRTKRKRKLVEWLESCQENQVNVLDEKIPLLSFAVDFVTAYEYQKARGIKIHPGLWKDMRVDIFLVKKEN